MTVEGALAAAVMTVQAVVTPVPGEVRIAAPAVCNPATAVTHESRRIAAPVQKQQHLPAGIQVGPDSRQQVSGEAVFQRLVADIDNGILGHARDPGAFRQRQASVALLFDIMQALQRGRGRAQQDGDIQAACPPYGQIACRVAEAFLLLQ